MANFNIGRGSRVYPAGSSFSGSEPKSPRRPVGKAVAAVVILAAGLVLVRYGRHHRSPAVVATAPEPTPIAVATLDAATVSLVEADVPPRVTAEEHTIQRKETLYDALVAEGFSREQVAALVTAAKPFANLGRVHPGMTFAVWHAADPSGFGAIRISSVQLTLAPNKILLAHPTPEGFTAEVKEIPYETKLASYTGDVDSTLWDAALRAKMDPNLIATLADVFAFDVDFNTEVRKGDRFRLVVQQKFLDGKPAGYGDILAAEYVNAGESHQAIRFENAAGDADYFAASGSSLRRMFLRSPLKYRRISSRFSSSRFHPVLHSTRAHQGVDYAADVGTPIRAVGEGVVEKSGWNGGSGNFVKIRHNSTYETSYSHLSAYGAGVKAGVKVRQGQIIGYVGQTGLATGPHLHFAFYDKGTYIDPLSKRFPAADPVSATEMAKFEAAKTTVLPLLPAWPDAGESPKIAGVTVHPAMLAPRLQ